MDTTVTPKAWYNSTTYRGIIIGAIASLYGILAKQYHWAAWDNSYNDVLTQVFQLIGVVMTIIGLRNAKTPIGDPSTPLSVPLVPAGTAAGEVPVAGVSSTPSGKTSGLE